MTALLISAVSALALRSGLRPSLPRSTRSATVSCTEPQPPEGDPQLAQTPSDAREALERVAAIDAEVLPPSYFESLRYDEDAVPWDLLGLPQTAVRNAAQSGAFGPPGTVILDCGCGSGDNANWLAARGYDVLGFDISANAVATARARSARPETSGAIAAAGGHVEFVQASATRLGAAERVQARARELGGLEVALDSALLHCLDDGPQSAYLDGLRRLVRPGGSLFVGCFSDANPDPWLNPRRLSEAQLRALFCEERGWRLREIAPVWYQRPEGRAATGGGAWTMAWWCRAEACVCSAVRPALALAGGGEGGRFPTPDTSPMEVVEAQLAALRAADLQATFLLFSRARRLALEDGARRDVREQTPAPQRVRQVLADHLRRECSGLLGHRSATITGSLTDPAPQVGLLPTWVCRVKLDTGATFTFKLTRQSRFDGGDPRDFDGFERCWLVWEIRRSDGGGSATRSVVPMPREPVPS